MAANKRIIRGLQDVKTISGSVDQMSIPYRAYMKLSCLEMEKFRRGKERESAMMRVEAIDSRFRDIEAEKASIKKLLEGQAVVRNDSARGDIPKLKTRTNTGVTKLRY